MPSKNYWQKRFEAMNESLLDDSAGYYDTAEKLFRKAQNSINADIAAWYQRFAANNQITLQDARKWLRDNELKEFRWTLEDYIKRGKENGVSADWSKELENASAKFHISRLESLKIQMQQHLEELYGDYLDGLNKTLRSTYEEAYYRTAYAMQAGFGADFELAALPKAAVDAVLNKPWASDGSNFSDRIWKDKAALLRNLQDELTQGLVRGDPQDTIIRRFNKRMDTSLSSAGRLIATESAFFAAKGECDNMKELGVEKYQFVATLDSRTSDICRSMDMKVIPMKDFQPGVTAPPLHCWCRSCTVPYMEDIPKGFRAARDEKGYTTHVPDMTYKDWKKVFVDKKVPIDLYQRNTPGADIIKEKALSGEINLNVNADKQGRHDKSSKLYREGKSYMTISMDEIQGIVNKYAGTGYIPMVEGGDWKNKESITLPREVGIIITGKSRKELPTNRITIHYSKTGVHVVPSMPVSKEEQE